MTKTHSSLFFADNWDMEDLFTSAEGAFKRERLRELGLERGIVLSSRDSREEMISFLSLLSFDGKQLSDLLDEAAPTERQPATTLRTADVIATVDEIQQAAEAVVRSRGDTNNEVIKVQTIGPVVRVKISYSHFDHWRTRLQQKRDKDAVIEFERIGGELRIRSTPDSHATAVIDAVVGSIGTPDAEPAKPKPLDLTGIRVARARTEFFLGILKNLRDYSNEIVSDVRLHRLDEEQDDDDGASNGDGAEDDEDTAKAARRKITRREKMATEELRNAALEGVNVLQTPFYKNLESKGYYISRAVWQSRSKKKASEAVEFEAWLHAPAEARDFRYRVRQIGDHDLDGNMIAPRKPDEAERATLNRILEDAATQSYAEVERTYVSKDKKAASAESSGA